MFHLEYFMNSIINANTSGCSNSLNMGNGLVVVLTCLKYFSCFFQFSLMMIFFRIPILWSRIRTLTCWRRVIWAWVLFMHLQLLYLWSLCRSWAIKHSLLPPSWLWDTPGWLCFWVLLVLWQPWQCYQVSLTLSIWIIFMTTSIQSFVCLH